MDAKILNCILVVARNKDNCSPMKCCVINTDHLASWGILGIFR